MKRILFSLLLLAPFFASAQTENFKWIKQQVWTASGTDTYTVSMPGMNSYVLGFEPKIRFTNANTAAATLQVGILAAIPLKKNGGVDLVAGDIAAGATYRLSYDGTNFQVLGIGGSGGGIGDVVGPASATSDNFPLFDGTTGKLLKNSSFSSTDAANAVTAFGWGNHAGLYWKTSGITTLQTPVVNILADYNSISTDSVRNFTVNSVGAFPEEFITNTGVEISYYYDVGDSDNMKFTVANFAAYPADVDITVTLLGSNDNITWDFVSSTNLNSGSPPYFDTFTWQDSWRDAYTYLAITSYTSPIDNYPYQSWSSITSVTSTPQLLTDNLAGILQWVAAGLTPYKSKFSLTSSGLAYSGRRPVVIGNYDDPITLMQIISGPGDGSFTGVTTINSNGSGSFNNLYGRNTIHSTADNTYLRFTSSSNGLKFMSNANPLNGVIVRPASVGSTYFLDLPLITANDLLVSNNATSTLTNKTLALGSNTISGTKAQFNTAVTDGDPLYVGDITQYTDELAQDAVGAMVDGSLTYVDGTPLLQRAALTGAITASAGSNSTALGAFTADALGQAITDPSRTVTSADAIVQADNGRTIYFDSATPFDFDIDILSLDTQVGFLNIGSADITLVSGTATIAAPVTLSTNESAAIIYQTTSTPIILSGGAGGSGDVVGPASAFDNGVARYDGTTGKLIQNAPVFIDDAGDVTVGIDAGTERYFYAESSGANAGFVFKSKGGSYPIIAENGSDRVQIASTGIVTTWLGAGSPFVVRSNDQSGSTNSTRMRIASGNVATGIAGDLDLETGSISGGTHGTVNVQRNASGKLGFFNATGVVKQSAPTNPQEIADVLEAYGLIPTSTIDYAPALTRKSALVIEADFYTDTSPYSPSFVGAAISGGTDNVISGEANHPGIIDLRDGTTANGGWNIATAANAFLIAGGERAVITFQIRNARATANGWMGFKDNTTNAQPVDGAYVYFIGNGTTVTMDARTRSNSTETINGSTWSPTLNTWYTLVITVNTGATRVDYEVFDDAGVSQWAVNNTTNIPTGSGRQTGFGIQANESTTDAAAAIMYVDYARMEINRTLTR